jgi:hypothetical protein
MRGWVVYLVGRCRLPILGGFAELDMQIGKLSMLRDSYRAQSQDPLQYKIVDVKNDRELLLTESAL